MSDLPATIDELMSVPGMWSKGRAAIPVDQLVTDVIDLGPDEFLAIQAHVESGSSLGIKPPDIKALRHTHHKLAQLLSMGMDETKAAIACNFSVSRVSQLKSDPAFANLLAHYKHEVDERFSDFVDSASVLSMDFLHLLQQQLDETPEKFTPATTLEAIKILADRTGHAPVQRSVNVNVNADLGSRLKAARERTRAALDASPPTGTAQ